MRRDKSTWRELIAAEMGRRSESFADVVQSTLSEADLDERFDSGYGGSEGAPFTVWTANRVYFPAVYDGSEWAASVPRNPCNDATAHVGGE